MCHRKSRFLRNFTHSCLLIFTDRHQCVPQLLLRQIIQRIGLILRCSNRTADRISSVRKLINSCIMTGCDIICTDLQTALQKRFPFDISVAGNTRIRCTPLKIFLRKIINDILLKFLSEIHNIIRNADPLCHSSGIVNRGKPAASVCSCCFLRILRLPDLHGHTDHIISLLFQKPCSNGGIHSSGHAYNYLFCHISLPDPLYFLSRCSSFSHCPPRLPCPAFHKCRSAHLRFLFIQKVGEPFSAVSVHPSCIRKFLPFQISKTPSEFSAPFQITIQ